MGHKVHPIGIRLGIRHTHSAHWYAKGNGYVFFLTEDQYLRSYVHRTYRQYLISEIEIDRYGISVRLRISVPTPQIKLLVGPDGKSLDIFSQHLQKKCHRFRRRHVLRFDFLQTSSRILENPGFQVFVRNLSSPEANARYLANFIVAELEKRTPFRRVIRISQEQAQNLDLVKGLRLQVSGRLNGAEIARTEWIRRGSVPLHTFSADLDYAYKTARTIYGLLGVKVWIFRIPQTTLSMDNILVLQKF
jgi:small subunit ribosomal protein S3